MSPDGAPITRDDIEARFRELNGEVTTEVSQARSTIVPIVVGVALAVVTVAFLAGKRRGRKRSAVIEVRRL